jgi:hypothetical protein
MFLYRPPPPDCIANYSAVCEWSHGEVRGATSGEGSGCSPEGGKPDGAGGAISSTDIIEGDALFSG